MLSPSSFFINALCHLESNLFPKVVAGVAQHRAMRFTTGGAPTVAGSASTARGTKRVSGGARGSKAASSTCGSVAGGASAAKKRKSIKAAGDCRCKVCGDSVYKVKWAETKDDKGQTIPIGDMCWSCKQTWAPFRERFENPDDFVEWMRTDEGEAEVAKANVKRARGSAESQSPEQVVTTLRHGGRVQRELWIANLLEFRQIFNKDPDVKMARLPQIQVPCEKGTGTETVFCFLVDEKTYPLRKYIMWCDISVEKASFDWETSQPLAFRAQAQVHYDRAVARQHDEWSQNVLYGSSQLMTVQDFRERFSPSPLVDLEASSHVCRVSVRALSAKSGHHT